MSGDEPLLVGEALDAIRARARAAGFSERAVFFIERAGAIWDEVQQAAQSLSLFAERRIGGDPAAERQGRHRRRRGTAAAAERGR